jgi:hypothetical protein
MSFRVIAPLAPRGNGNAGQNAGPNPNQNLNQVPPPRQPGRRPRPGEPVPPRQAG